MAKEEAAVWLVLTSCSKEKKKTTENHTTFGESAMPSDCSAEQTWKREEIPEETTS